VHHCVELVTLIEMDILLAIFGAQNEKILNSQIRREINIQVGPMSKQSHAVQPKAATWGQAGLMAAVSTVMPRASVTTRQGGPTRAPRDRGCFLVRGRPIALANRVVARGAVTPRAGRHACVYDEREHKPLD
jgi:hypothetical protein